MSNSPNDRLPVAFSLIGTNSLPAIDNQGGIGSCASQAVTLNQFTNAVSRYLCHVCTDKPFNAKDRQSFFSPRFTYNFSGAGTAWVYETLMDHGALSFADCPFEKNEAGASLRVKDGALCKTSAAWPVTEAGLMKKALSFRLRRFQQIWSVKEPYSEQLTTTKVGQDLLFRIKKAVVDGNCVVTGGYPARWIYADVEGIGSYGRQGDTVVVAAAGEAPGGHQVTIVGYDDDITASFGGVTLKGAFQIANSYGEGWCNQGYTFLMYDACNTVSEHEALNDTALYSGQMFLTPAKANKMFPANQTAANQTLTFRQIGMSELQGEDYAVYTIYDSQGQTYLGYSTKAEDRTVKGLKEADAQAEWCLIPYEKLRGLNGFIAEEYCKDYEGTYWIYAKNRILPDSQLGFLDAGLAFSASGRETNLATLNGGRYPTAKSWTIENASAGDFCGKLGIAAGKDAVNHKVWALDQFCFTDWRSDVVVGMPKLVLTLEIEAADRDSFLVELTRRDPKGGVVSHRPAMFRYRDYHPAYCKKSEGEYITFSAQVNGEPEIGYFAFSYEPLLEMADDSAVENYVWGLRVEAEKQAGVVVKRAALLCGRTDTEITVLVPNETVDGQLEMLFEF